MKSRLKIVMILTTIIFAYSCKTEKNITTNEPVLGITENSKMSGSFNTENNNKPTTPESRIKYQEQKTVKLLTIREELINNNIPTVLNVIPLEKWHKYYDAIEKSKTSLSNDASLYAYKTLLEQFDLFSLDLSLTEQKSIYTIFERMIQKKWSNYTRIYAYMKYFKTNEASFPDWRSLQNTFNTYAKVLEPVKSTKPNDERAQKLLENEAFMKEMMIIEKKFFENNDAVAKIKAL